MIYLGSDHRGYNLKEKIKAYLDEQGLEYEDLGNDHLDPEDDYPDWARRVGEKVGAAAFAEASASQGGIVICGSGVGMCVTANKIKGVRCGLGFNSEQIMAARKEDDINCLALPADFLDTQTAIEIVQAFLETEFDNQEKHKRRIRKMEGGEIT